jgi:hypothetical protein
MMLCMCDALCGRQATKQCKGCAADLCDSCDVASDFSGLCIQCAKTESHDCKLQEKGFCECAPVRI